MTNITNDGLTRMLYIAAPIWHQWCQRIKYGWRISGTKIADFDQKITVSEKRSNNNDYIPSQYDVID